MKQSESDLLPDNLAGCPCCDMLGETRGNRKHQSDKLKGGEWLMSNPFEGAWYYIWIWGVFIYTKK